jgi:hypothetical protein
MSSAAAAASCGSVGLPSTGFGSLGINLVLTPNQTNSVQLVSSIAFSAAVAINAITNHSERSVLVIPAIERRRPPLQIVDLLQNTQRLLAAHSEILVTLTNTPPERAAVHCQRDRFFSDPKGVATKAFDTYVFCRKANEMVYEP